MIQMSNHLMLVEKRHSVLLDLYFKADGNKIYFKFCSFLTITN